MCKECNEIMTIPNLYRNGEEVKLWISNSKPRVPFKYNVGYITSKNETIIKHIYGGLLGTKEKYAKKFYIVKCNKCKAIFYKAEKDIDITKCGVCESKLVYKGINDIWTTQPQLGELLLNKEDGYKYPNKSNLKLDFVCQDCGCILNRKIYDIQKRTCLFCEECKIKQSSMKLVGKKFGRWTVLELDEESNTPKNKKDGCRIWVCQCECGTIKSVFQSGLLNGKSISCGCYNIEQKRELRPNKIKNIIGQRFNMLTVIELCEERGNSGDTLWKCKCDCGNICYIEKGHLIQGDTKSCGCLRHRLGENNPCWKHELTEEDRDYTRTISGYGRWKQQVKELAHYTCDCCGYVGEKNDGIMRSHHLNNYDTHKELAVDINNGVCLCLKCHTMFHTKHMGHCKIPCTEQDYIEFKQRFLKGEFNDLLGDDLND